MIIDFSKIDVNEIKKFKDGDGSILMRMQDDGMNKIMYATLAPGSSIGMHTHETNSEILFVTEGCGKVIYDGDEIPVSAGICHYCPKGHTHSLINNGDCNLVFFAVVPEQ